LFVDAPGCVFVLGLDQEVIARGVEIRYHEFFRNGERNPIDGAKYLEKIIQVPFQIPPVERTDLGDFVVGLTAEWLHNECPRIFAEGLGDNPRQIKRTVNTFLMLWKLAQKRQAKLGDRIKPIRLAKVVVIQAIYPELYSLLKETPRYLRDLEEYYRSETQIADESFSEKIQMFTGAELPRTHDDVLPKVELPPALINFISRNTVRLILTLHAPDLPDANFVDLTPDELRTYFTLTRRVEAPQAEPVQSVLQVFEPQLIRIPAGKFLIGTTKEQAQKILDSVSNKDEWKKWLEWEQPQHEVELSEYSIGKYPVTNREYQFFVKDGGAAPQGWDDGQYPPERGDHPVVNVSWEVAQAYCKWLGEKTKKYFGLPTEAQWEKAARGTDGRVYPWGDEFDKTKANIDETGIGDTSPVGQFAPQGDSPYGCVDMAGNVWEWCADWFDKNEYKNRIGKVVKDPHGPENGSERALRGGSWGNFLDIARVSCRSYSPADDRGGTLGFRVVALPSDVLVS
jgi:toxoflavin biosynthesis protein ToxD